MIEYTFPCSRFSYTEGTASYGPLSFSYEDASDVVAYLVDTNGSGSQLEYGTDYSVSGTTVSILADLVSKYGSGYSFLSIMRCSDVTQKATFVNGRALDVKKIESALDRMEMQIQDIRMVSDNCIKVACQDWKKGGETVQVAIPPAAVRASHILAFDSSGKTEMILTDDISQKLAEALAAEETTLGYLTEAEKAKKSAQTYAELAEAWATKTTGPVEGTEKSAKLISEELRSYVGSTEDTGSETVFGKLNNAESAAVAAVNGADTTSARSQALASISKALGSSSDADSALGMIESAKNSAIDEFEGRCGLTVVDGKLCITYGEA